VICDDGRGVMRLADWKAMAGAGAAGSSVRWHIKSITPHAACATYALTSAHITHNSSRIKKARITHSPLKTSNASLPARLALLLPARANGWRSKMTAMAKAAIGEYQQTLVA